MKAAEIQHEIWASYCFPPFEKLVRFLEDIMSNNLPSYFDVDQEGSFKYFGALPHENGIYFTSPFETHAPENPVLMFPLMAFLRKNNLLLSL